MTLPSSSTVEAKELRHGTVVVSADTGRVVRNIGIIPLSAETLTTTLAHPENFPAALKMHLANADVSAGVVTCRRAEHTGWLIFKSPTVRFTTEPFQPVALFPGAAEWLPYERNISLSGMDLSAVTTFRVVTISAAQPLKSAAGLFSSTDPTLGLSRLVESKLAAAFALAGQEWFEDGIESDFSRALSTLVHTYGDTAISVVETFLGSPTTNTEVAVEAAQWLGEVDHPASYRYRKTLLERLLLTAPSTRLRHGAAAGLAAMDDPSSLSALVKARDRESNRRLRHFLELVVDQLERTRACRSS